MLFGPDVREWLSDTHPSHFISNIVEKLDLTEIYKSYEKYVDEKAERKKERKKENDFWMEENGENLERRLPSIQTENQYLKLFQPVVIRRITTPE